MDRNEAIDKKHEIEAAFEKANIHNPEGLAFALTLPKWRDTVKLINNTINGALGFDDMEMGEEELAAYRKILAKQVLDKLRVNKCGLVK